MEEDDDDVDDDDDDDDISKTVHKIQFWGVCGFSWGLSEHFHLGKN